MGEGAGAVAGVGSAAGKLEFSILHIVKHEFFRSGQPVAAAGRLAVLPPVGYQIVVVAEVGQLVIGAGESGNEGLDGGQLGIGEEDFGAALRDSRTFSF